MKRTKLAVAIGLLATTSLCTAADSLPSTEIDSLLSGWTQGASVALTTDYVWRGISQTNSDPAIQGQFDLTHDSGFYVGVWASNVEFRDGSKNSIEIDGWVGFSNEIDLSGVGLTYDIGFLHYEFPAFSGGNIDEIYFGLGVSPIEDLNLSAYYYHDLGIENKFANYYVDFSADYTLPDSLSGVTLLAHLGHYDRQAGANDYWDWKVGVAKDIAGFNLEVAYLNTDTSEDVGSSGNGNNSDSRVVVTISRELDGSSAKSQDMLPDSFTTSASVALTTDYVWRGISQTMNDAAIQGSFDVAHDSGAYIGAWGSNVEFGGTESLELDLYAGFTNEIDLSAISSVDLGLTYDVGFLHYEYPSNSSANFSEIYFGLGMTPVEDLALSLYYYDDLGIENKFFNYYVDMKADYTLPDWALGATLVSHLGHFDRQDGASDYWDWKLGVAKDIGDFNFEVAYLDTDDGASGDDADARVVATVSASF